MISAGPMTTQFLTQHGHLTAFFPASLG